MLYDTRSSMLATLMFLCDYMNESKFVWLLWSLALWWMYVRAYVGSRLIDFLVEYILTNQQVAFFFLIYIIDTVEPWVGKAPCSIKQSVGKAGN